MLAEPVSRWDFFGIIAGFLGMLMVMQPYKATAHEGLLDLLGCLLAFAAAILYALSTIYVKILARANMHFTVNSTYFNIGILILSPITTFFIPRRIVPIYDSTYFLLIIVSSIFFFISLVAYPIPMRELSGGTIGVLMYLSIPLSVL